jgi:hypothetical protein
VEHGDIVGKSAAGLKKLHRFFVKVSQKVSTYYHEVMPVKRRRKSSSLSHTEDRAEEACRDDQDREEGVIAADVEGETGGSADIDQSGDTSFDVDEPDPSLAPMLNPDPSGNNGNGTAIIPV